METVIRNNNSNNTPIEFKDQSEEIKRVFKDYILTIGAKQHHPSLGVRPVEYRCGTVFLGYTLEIIVYNHTMHSWGVDVKNYVENNNLADDTVIAEIHISNGICQSFTCVHGTWENALEKFIEKIIYTNNAAEVNVEKVKKILADPQKHREINKVETYWFERGVKVNVKN